MTIIAAIFCMAQLYATNPVKQWGQLQVKVHNCATKVEIL